MIPLEEAIPPRVFVPPALNLFAMTVFLAGLTTMVSAGSNYRSRTIGIVGGFYAVSMVVKIVGRMVPGWHWLDERVVLHALRAAIAGGQRGPGLELVDSQGPPFVRVGRARL